MSKTIQHVHQNGSHHEYHLAYLVTTPFPDRTHLTAIRVALCGTGFGTSAEILWDAVGAISQVMCCAQINRKQKSTRWQMEGDAIATAS